MQLQVLKTNNNGPPPKAASMDKQKQPIEKKSLARFLMDKQKQAIEKNSLARSLVVIMGRET
jgi:hypothetical protein